MAYDLGAVVPLSITIRDTNLALANAGAVTLTIALPDATSFSSGTINPTSTGIYEYAYPSVQSGRHGVRWVATGSNAGAFTDVFEVLDAAPPQIVSLADAKAQLNIDADDTTDDTEILRFIRAATAVVEMYVGAVVRRTVVETFNGGRPELLLSTSPVLSITSVVDFGSTLDPAAYKFNPASAVLTKTAGGVYRVPFLPGSNTVVVTYIAGTSATAPNVAQAALIILAHMWETQRSAAGGRPPLGEEPVVDTARYSVPYRALELLGRPLSGLA